MISNPTIGIAGAKIRGKKTKTVSYVETVSNFKFLWACFYLSTFNDFRKCPKKYGSSDFFGNMMNLMSTEKLIAYHLLEE